MDRTQELRLVYGRLVGFVSSLTTVGGGISNSFLIDLKDIFQKIENITENKLTDFRIDTVHQWNGGSGTFFCDSQALYSKACQLKSYLEYGYNVNDKIVQIGSLYNTIKDNELRERCGDLLTAPDHFDRVVAQATQILENRLRIKSRIDVSITGINVINQSIKADPSDSILVISNIRSEQEGFANICKGLILFMRNETHHQIVSTYTREDAFAICGFIDKILRLVDNATVNVR